MYYIFASVVVGAFIGSSAMVSQPNHPHHVSHLTETKSSIVSSVSNHSAIVDNQALSAESTGL
jgi:hypothetical protein